MNAQTTTANAVLADALKALTTDPKRAEALCRAVLQSDPANGDAKLVLSEALRRKGDLPAARALALEETQRRPEWFGGHRQLGIVLAEMGEAFPASLALRAAADLVGPHPTIWRELADQLALAGDISGAEQAYLRHATGPLEPKLQKAAKALSENDLAVAEPILTEHLEKHPNDVAALRLLSEAQARADRPDKAEATLRRVLHLAPEFGLARHSLAQLLMGLGRVEEAHAEAKRLAQQSPETSQRLLAATLNAVGEQGKAAEIYKRVLDANPRLASTWMSYGHMLKTLGRSDEAITAYREAIARAPQAGEAYWSLANLKTFRFTDADVAQMRAQLERPQLTQDERVNMLFALGKAAEDANDAETAFNYYRDGASLHRQNNAYESARHTAFIERSAAFFTADFFARHNGAGAQAGDPIFILGLPRSGSTLVEQILASHSAVEGTAELPDLQNVARDLISPDQASAGTDYLEGLAELETSAFAALGETYLRTTRVHRKQGTPLFIDKMPNNWALTGFIHLILPNAKIIDARRHPMACGWSCFKQHFALGQLFTYDLEDLGRYYRDYVCLMAHFDAVLPGRVHRVVYEDLVRDPETHIRDLLDYCALPFEEACLRPHETARAVRTASSEQVRQPISAKGLDGWKKFEPWLGPLKSALGPVLDVYPNAP